MNNDPPARHEYRWSARYTLRQGPSIAASNAFWIALFESSLPVRSAPYSKTLWQVSGCIGFWGWRGLLLKCEFGDEGGRKG